MFRVDVSDATLEEVVSTSLWMEQNRSGYGEKFIQAYERAVASLEQYPFSNRLRFGKSRSIPISPFSYLLVYKVYDDYVLVQRLVHMKRSLRKQYRA